MTDVKNLTLNEVMERSINFPLIPRFNKVIITINVDEADGELILDNNSFSEVQYVMAVGPHVKDLVPGQKVALDIEKMLVYDQSETNSHEKISRIKIKPIEVDGVVYALINDTVIDALDNR